MEEWKLEPARDHGMPLKESFKSLKREDGLLASASHLLWWTIVKSYLFVAHRATVVGRRNLPKRGPFVLIGNHSSHLDVMLLASSLPLRLRSQALPVAAGDTFFDSRGKSAFSALAMNALPMWRASGGMHAIKELRGRVTSTDCVLIIFPEGTRSRTGELGEFKPGLGMIVAGTEVPVVPCRLEGCFDAFPAGQKYPRFSKIRLRVGEALDFSGEANDRAGWTAVAERCKAAIEVLSGR